MRSKVTLAESTTCAVVLASLAAVLVPGVSGWQGTKNDRRTQQDLTNVATAVDRFHRQAMTAGSEVSNLSVEAAPAGRVRIFPAEGPAELLDVAEGTQVVGPKGVIHYKSGSWCLSFTNPRGRAKTYHSHSSRSTSKGECPPE